MNGLWNSQGFLPPIDPNEDGAGLKRAPYLLSLCQLVDLFSYTKERREILAGFLGYRRLLHSIGLTSGFQWINGSFTQNIEIQENRAPKDIDVVTFASLPSGHNQESFYNLNSDKLNKSNIKNRFKVDHFYFELGRNMEKRHITQINYWYSLWSHNRNQVWKGFLEVSLNPQEDLLLRHRMCFNEIEARIE